MKKKISSNYQDIRDQIMGILQGKNLIRKALLMLGLFGTIASLVMLLIQAIYWVILFIAGVVLLSAAMKKPTSNKASEDE